MPGKRPQGIPRNGIEKYRDLGYFIRRVLIKGCARVKSHHEKLILPMYLVE